MKSIAAHKVETVSATELRLLIMINTDLDHPRADQI